MITREFNAPAIVVLLSCPMDECQYQTFPYCHRIHVLTRSVIVRGTQLRVCTLPQNLKNARKYCTLPLQHNFSHTLHGKIFQQNTSRSVIKEQQSAPITHVCTYTCMRNIARIIRRQPEPKLWRRRISLWFPKPVHVLFWILEKIIIVFLFLHVFKYSFATYEYMDAVHYTPFAGIFLD